uniref:Uncharacterized protein n=1 Tax=Daucus carota subsp. sativus TaxID=79200 RepID=A0A164ZIK6_DAUCS
MAMWLREGVGGLKTQLVRHFSRKCAPNLRKINPRVPPQEANSIAEGLYQVIKDHGPLTVPNTWNQVKWIEQQNTHEANVKVDEGKKDAKAVMQPVGTGDLPFDHNLPDLKIADVLYLVVFPGEGKFVPEEEPFQGNPPSVLSFIVE